jgi:ATP-dependent DNA helicase RecQ
VNDSLHLFNQGLSVDEICEKRELKSSTIYSHLANAIVAGELESRQVLSISEDEILEIESMAKFMDISNGDAVGPLFEAMEEKWDYGLLRCVISGLG